MQNSNTYIMNLEASYIYKDIINKKKIVHKNKNMIKLFSATMPYSLEAIRMNKMFDKFYYEIDEKQYTNKIINITFNKNYTEWDENKEWKDKKGNTKKGKRIILKNKKQIRKYLYMNGFIMDGIKYVFYKRGAGKAKNGYALYIQEDIKDKLIQRSRLDLQFNKDEELDFTSLLAYESLISSGIDFTIELDPENKQIITNNKEIEIQNCLTDGQGLLDESVFKEYDKENKGMMLLRSDFLKCCAFNTKLQQFFKYHNVKTIKDMFGNIYNIDKIKLIITPNSLKFLKFAYKIEKGSKKECYKYWQDHIDNIFGVVKCDKEGNYGNYNRLTYQLLNSIPNLTYNELMDITKLERKYVMLLKNDNAVFRNYLGCDAKASLKLEKGLDEGDISLYESTDLMNTLMLVNSDIQYTTKFKKMKSDLISNYIGHLKEGKIRIKDTKYVTIVSNPYEMLLSLIGKYNNQSIMQGREVFCQYYKNNQEFCISRNPHINAGNVMYAKNVYHEEYKWFNLTDNIMIVNFFDNDMPDRLQGEDTDSDVNLVISNPILIEKAKYCEKNFPTPINKVKGQSKPRKYNMKELQKLDTILSNNYIGRIVNMSQIINSYLNQAIADNKSKEIIDELYQASSKLSSMSQIEIDKSKKVFDNINMGNELVKMRQIKSIKYIEEKDKYGQLAKKMIVPKFFNMISDSNDYRVFEKFNTSLDILQDVLTFKGGKRHKGGKNKELIELLVQSKELDGIYQVNSAKAIFKVVNECGKKINGLKLKTCTLNDKAKNTIKRKSKEEAVKKIKKLKPSDATILGVLKQCFGDKENDNFGFKKYAMLTLNLLFVAK